MKVSELRIQTARLWQSLEEMAQRGATPDGGVCRLALSDADKEGRDLFCDWLRNLGLTVQIDQVGNILAIRPGSQDEAPVLIGSHLDTVSTGGRFDGAAGVLAGLEVLRTLEEKGIRTRRPLGLVSFTNEEGARYTTDMMGSQAFCGELSVEQVWAIRGLDGTLVGEELRRIGYAGDFPCGAIRPYAYLELHIEQGPQLDRAGIPIGIVEAITGLTWLEVIVRGAANHAGTTPMDNRRDAALAAARIVASLPDLASSIPDQRATCGRFSVAPGIVNVIPHEAIFTVDLRNGDPARLLEAETQFRARVQEISSRSNVLAEIRLLGHVPPQRCDPQVVSVIESVATDLAYPSRRMVSGAGHDAQILARICPTAMIFIPSRDGVSHSPAEYSTPEALEAGANVLLHTALRLAGVERA
ncbi:MAG: Zn-dependent hydrolase [Anaerolineales bacterium]|nr:Zn-dependent hydrolase [Anaerolineales bacterium]